MAELLEIIIGANVDDAKAGVKDLQNVLTQFAQQGKLSIGVLEQTLVNLKQQIKITTDPTEARKLADAFQLVQAKLNNLKIQGGLQQSLGGISRSARIAHADLEQMASSIRGFATGSERGVDAIGNLVFTFERLQGITGGAGAAVSALGETLLGPAGLVLAFTTLVPLVLSFVEGLFNSEGAAEANQKAFDDLNETLDNSKKAFEALQTQVKFLDQIGPINLDIQFGKGFQTDILELNARVLELNDEILAQQKVFADAQNARIAADKAAADAEIAGKKKVIEETKKQSAEALKIEEDANKKLIDLSNERSVLFRKTEQTRTNEQREQEKKRADDAKAAATELNRSLIALAKEAEKAFDVPLRLKFDSTDLDVDKLRKAREVLAGIKDFVIKARIDIELPDIKELPKEQVEKFFKEVPNALQDAVDKGLIDAGGRELKIDLGPFAKEIQAEIDKFNQAGLEIPVTFDLKDADLLIKLRDAFPIEQIQKNVDELKKSLGTEDTFQGFIRDFIKLGDEGQKAFDATAKAALDAGDNITEALRKAADAQKSIGGISKEAGEAAIVLQQTLGPAFENLFSSIIQGQAPLEAFFKSLIQGIDQLIAKLIAAALEALILSSITGGIGGFGGIFKALLGFEKGGDPAPDKPFIAGEKGWELIVPKTSMHVFTHEQSKSILSSSLKESESIKEYLIAAKVSQQLKEHFSYAFRSIESTIKTVTTSHDKLISYSYKLHESVTSLKETIASDKTNNNFYQSVSSIIKEFSSSDKQTLATISATISDKIKEIIPYAKPSDNITSKETVATIVKGDNESSHYENSLERITTSLKDHSASFKELHSTSTKTIDRLHESVTNNLSSSIDKLHEKIIERSDKSVTIERIINNNFFSSDSFKETFKSMSLTDLQKTFHIPAFAQGGAVFGPTLAILGEGFGISRGNPEFVGTRSQLSGIQGGQFDVNVNVDGELSFDMGKLAIALNRNQRSSFRTSGKPGF